MYFTFLRTEHNYQMKRIAKQEQHTFVYDSDKDDNGGNDEDDDDNKQCRQQSSDC